jgi:hypothetical protein
MKRRDGHVSNSSSTSFIVIIGQKEHDAVYGELDDDIRYLLLPDLAEHIALNGEPVLLFRGSCYLGADGAIFELQKFLNDKIPGKFFMDASESGGG